MVDGSLSFLTLILGYLKKMNYIPWYIPR